MFFISQTSKGNTMTYRTIEVNNKVYEYTTGKTHTKIKGVGVFLNETIGSMHEYDVYCDCCGEPESTLYNTPMRSKLAVKPADIKEMILKLV